MSKSWLAERRRDHYYKQAKKDNYRSRAAFKLSQINTKFKMIKNGDVVIDLGAAPGGWSQVAIEATGTEGFVIAIDLDHIKPIDGVTFYRGDITEPDSFEWVERELQRMGKKKANVIISDISPNISGNYSMDHSRSIYLCQKVLFFAENFLSRRGHIVMKVFQGAEMNALVKDLKTRFGFFKFYSPQAYRKSSSEIFIICKRYNPAKE